MAPGVIYGRRGSGRAIDGNVGLGLVETLGARDASPSGLTSTNTSTGSLTPCSQQDALARPGPNRKHSGFLKMVFKTFDRSAKLQELDVDAGKLE